MFRIALTLLAIVSITACGGGGGAAVTGITTDNTKITENFNSNYDSNSGKSTSTAMSGSASINMNNIFNTIISRGNDEYLADMQVYSKRNLVFNNTLTTDIKSNNALTNTTIATIYSPNSNLKTGDKIEITSIPKDVNGIPYEEINGEHTISLLSEEGVDSFWYKDYFYISVNGSAHTTGAPNSIIKLAINGNTNTITNGMYTDIKFNNNGTTKIRIPTRNHGLKEGDKISILANQNTINGILERNFAGIFSITSIDNSYFQIQVNGQATSNGLPDKPFNFTAQVSSLECNGTHDFIRNPINTTSEPILKQGYEVYSTKSITSNRFDSCTPQFTDDIITTQYYRINNGNYILVAQETSTGSYSIANSDWNFFTGELTSNLPETNIGRINNYSDSSLNSYMGYTIFSYETKPNTTNSVYLFSYMKNYSAQDVLLSTLVDIYQIENNSAQLIQSKVKYNNSASTEVDIINFSAKPDYPIDRKSILEVECLNLTFLSCQKYFY